MFKQKHIKPYRIPLRSRDLIQLKQDKNVILGLVTASNNSEETFHNAVEVLKTKLQTKNITQVCISGEKKKISLN